jgi:hypothetical protein
MKNSIVAVAAVLFVAVLPAAADQDRISGNWQMIAMLAGESPTYIATTIARSGNSLSGVFYIMDQTANHCFPAGVNTPNFTGTVEGNAIELQSAPTIGGAPFANQVITMNLRLSRLSQIMYGTFSVAGGCDDGDYGDVTGRFVPDLSGNWSGTFGGPLGEVAVTAALTQAQVADSNGWFVITGTMDFGLPCFTSATVTGSTSGGYISFGEGSTLGVTGIVQDAPIAKRLFVWGTLYTSCAYGAFNGALTRP